MGCRILVGHEQGYNWVEQACFFDSVTGTVFGLLMNDEEEAESFQEWVKKKFDKDLRQLTHAQFEDYLGIFREEREKEDAKLS